MVPWIEREELVSYDEIDDFIKELEQSLIKYCCSNPYPDDISIRTITDIAGHINALKELKVIHHRNYEQNLPPDPLGPLGSAYLRN